MTPAQRQYDIMLVDSARRQAKTISKRSAKTALIINQLCDRVDALSGEILNQPASTPAEPVMGNGEKERAI